MKCAICDSDPIGWSWTDTHGVAQCIACGNPYRLIHYAGDPPVRIENPPELLIADEYIECMRAYWREMKRTAPGGHSFPGGHDLATDNDIRAFNDWMDENVQRFLQSPCSDLPTPGAEAAAE